MKKQIFGLGKPFFLVLLFFIFFLLVALFRYRIMDMYYWYSHNNTNKHPARTYVPSKYDLIGFDISRYQQNFNWKQASLINQYNDTIPASFVIVKATEGTQIIDPYFQYNKNRALRHPEIEFGAYHYFHVNESPQKQADFFVDTANLQEGNMLPVVDIEETHNMSKDQIKEKLNLFCNLLENKYGKKPIIYSNKDFLLNVLEDNYKEYPIWVAHYGVQEISLPSDWNWAIWQFTDKGSSFGAQGYIDVNVFNGNESDFEELLIP